MAKNIHPAISTTQVLCGGCNNSFQINSTLGEADFRVEFCHSCHPGYTGIRKISKAGRVEQFNDKYRSFRKKSTETK